MSDSEQDREDEAKKKRTVAVALAHDLVDKRPPKVVAGGRGRIAEQIIEIAFAHGIKVREDADLAELLSSIDIDSEIPVEAFAAVAEILTYVYQVNAQLPPAADRAPGAPDAPGRDGDAPSPADGGLSTLWSKEPQT